MLTGAPHVPRPRGAAAPEPASPPAPVRVPRHTPILETALFLVAALAADWLWGGGDRFAGLEPHPFWIIVLFMAVQYGTIEALQAAGAASVALLAWNLPAHTFDQTVHEYALEMLWRPLLWIAAAVVFGELRVRHKAGEADLATRLQTADRRVALLSRAHGELSSAKERLETRLAGQLRTATEMVDAARAIETLDPSLVIAGASELVTVAIHARQFSLFLLKGDALILAAQQGWTEEGVYAQRYPSTAPLFREVVGAQRFVSVASPVGETILAGQGLMAGPLIHPKTGELLGMLKVEDMHFLDFNLSNVQTFKALCGWIATAYANAVAHEADQIVDETTRLYGMKFLERQTGYITEIAQRFGFDLTLLFFKVEVDGLTDDQRRALPAVLGTVSRHVLRGTDLVFSHEPAGTQFAALLPGATADGAVVVSRKLMTGLREACGYQVPCTTQVRVLCVAHDAQARHGLRGHGPAAEKVA